jgi:hypothetical protein
MQRRRLPISLAAALLGVLAAAPARSYEINSRWSRTATNATTGAQGTPVTVTWSFAPDNTTLPAEVGGNSMPKSRLIAFLDNAFGAGPGGSDYTQRPWFTFFQQATSRLSAVSGVTFVYESQDDGATFSSANSGRGILGTRGDVRLGAKVFPSSQSTTLAESYFPNYSDMVINSDYAGTFAIASNNYRFFRNTLMHELMHGLGLGHVVSSTSSFLIQPSIMLVADGPQLDDILGLHRLYGDALEKNGGNDTAATATMLGALSSGQSIVRGTLGNSTIVDGSATDFLSIDDLTDADYFKFTLAEPLAVTLQLDPRGASYRVGRQNTGSDSLTNPYKYEADFNAMALSDLSLTLFDANAVQLAPTANQNGAGAGETIVRELEAGSYLFRIAGAQSQVQLYGFSITGAPIAPDHLTWIGSVAGIWNAASISNFQNGSTADVFRNGDQVTFGEGGAFKTVTIATPVAPSSMTVNAASDYTFNGAGITTSMLMVSGSGKVTLANSGNALGAVSVLGGTLQITGSANAPFAGAVHVAQGASLQINAAQTFAESSQLTGGGQILGDVAMPGTIAPGGLFGTLTFTDDLTLSSTSVVAIDLGGTLAGAQYDVVSILGDATLAGTLNVTLSGSFQPAAGSAFSLLTTAGALTGAFATLSLPDLGSSLQWHASYLPHEVVLTISASVTFAEGDFNHDGRVDLDDLSVWAQWYGQETGAPHTHGDANGDGAVDGLDFLAWQRGLSTPGATAGLGAEVPEPTSWTTGLVACAAGLAASRRRRRLA